MKFLNILKEVYRNKKYFFLTIIVSVLAFILFYKLMLAKIADNSLKIFVKMSGYNYSFFTLLSFVIISVLFGIYLSLIVYRIYKFKELKKKNRKKGILGYFGFIAGIFGAGCPTCGSLVFAIFGAPLALTYLPFRGLELTFLSIIILLVSIYILSRNLNGVCKIR